MKTSTVLGLFIAAMPGFAFAVEAVANPSSQPTAAALVATTSVAPFAPADPASAEPNSVETPALWISVHLPKDTKPAWVGDDVAEHFADRVSQALHAQGFKGRIGTLCPEDVPAPHASVLEINLSEWTARAGTADCTFRASLQTPQGSRALGLFSGDAMVVTADGEHPVSSSGLRDAARYAMADIYKRIEESNLLPTR